MMYQELAGQVLDAKKPAIQDHSVMTRYPESIYHH
jgi:hypothetical protein